MSTHRWIICGLWVVASIGYSQNDNAFNYRDKCRSIIVGNYWKVVDTMNTNQQFYLHQKDQLKKIQKELKVFKKKKKNLMATRKTKAYDTKRDRQIHVLTAKIEFLEKSEIQTKEKIPSFKKRYTKLKGEHADLKKRMQKVFVIKDDKTKIRGQYPKSIEYKTQCSKFRHVCPLPTQEREDLMKIFKHIPVSEACLKYTYIR